jgi:hypothetical protein
MIRTCDQRFRKPLLYPLSYEGGGFILTVCACQANGRESCRATPPVMVEYVSRGKRVRETLPDSWTARQFYTAKFKAGRKPSVVYKQTG